LSRDAQDYLSNRKDNSEKLEGVYDALLSAFSETRLIQNLPLHRIHRSWIRDRLDKEPTYISQVLLDYLSRDCSLFYAFKKETGSDGFSPDLVHPEVLSHLKNEFLQPFVEAQDVAVFSPLVQKLLSLSIESIRGMTFQLGRMGIRSLGERYPEIAENLHLIGQGTRDESTDMSLDEHTVSLLSLKLSRHIDGLMKTSEPMMALGVMMLAMALAGERRSAVLSVAFTLPLELGTFLRRLCEESPHGGTDEHVRSLLSRLILKESTRITPEKG
jgi:hypothetical protein